MFLQKTINLKIFRINLDQYLYASSLGVMQKHQLVQATLDYDFKNVSNNPALLEKNGWALKAHIQDYYFFNRLEWSVHTQISSFVRLDTSTDFCIVDNYFLSKIWQETAFKYRNSL